MDCLDAIRFYEGDVEASEDSLYSDAKAYVTFNAIYFDGIENEQIKRLEHKKLNPQFIQRYKEIYEEDGVAHQLLKQMAKDIPHPVYHTTRVERLADFVSMQKAQRTIAFTSTSTGSFLSQYGDKQGIVLLEFVIPSHIPCIDFASVLPHYAKTEEAEVLLPPFLSLQMEEVPLSQEESNILDREGNGPVGKYKVTCTGMDLETIPYVPVTDEMLKNSMALYQQLEDCVPIHTEYVESYLQFKQAMQAKTKEQLIKLFSGKSSL